MKSQVIGICGDARAPRHGHAWRADLRYAEALAPAHAGVARSLCRVFGVPRACWSRWIGAAAAGLSMADQRRIQELESFLAKLPRPTPTYAVQAGDIFQTAQLTEENSVAYHTTANAGSTPPTSGTTSSALRPPTTSSSPSTNSRTCSRFIR